MRCTLLFVANLSVGTENFLLGKVIEFFSVHAKCVNVSPQPLSARMWRVSAGLLQHGCSSVAEQQNSVACQCRSAAYQHRGAAGKHAVAARVRASGAARRGSVAAQQRNVVRERRDAAGEHSSGALRCIGAAGEKNNNLFSISPQFFALVFLAEKKG